MLNLMRIKIMSISMAVLMVAQAPPVGSSCTLLIVAESDVLAEQWGKL
ncbi:MAG: hypothetical protein FWG02_09830 [Holophagaceae bacterium]|nr:hypothetical protein [Holophagaceae bacterium]